MSFIKEVIDESMDVWKQCYETKFVQEMSEGTLPFEKFKHYIIQDSLYLKEYARVYAMAMYRSKTLKDIQMFYGILSFVTEGESTVRLNYLREFGMDDDDVELILPTAENKAYTDFMLNVAEQGDVPEILMAVLPCMMGYCYVMSEAVKSFENIERSRYWDLISDYANDNYVACCKIWGEYTEKKCVNLSIKRKEKLAEIFRQASLHELYFWKMAYGVNQT